MRKLLTCSILIFAIFPQLTCTKKAADYPNLKIVDLKKGSGNEVGSRDTILVRYEGRFLNGQVFDQSPRDGSTRRYSLSARTLIMGWRLGLVGMKEGGKRRLTIPPDLAYGKKGKGSKIPPHTTLIFDVELLKIQ